MKAIQRVVVLVVVAFSLFLGSLADPAMLNLDFPITLTAPAPNAGLQFAFFEGTPHPRADGVTYGFTSDLKQHINRGVNLTPGTQHFSFSVDVENLANFHFMAWGSTIFSQTWPAISLYAAAPTNGIYDPAAAWFIGPPWVSLAKILTSDRLGNTISVFNGPGNPLGGYDVGSWELTASEADVPEPASLVLLGTGVAMVLRRRHLAKKKSEAHARH